MLRLPRTNGFRRNPAFPGSYEREEALRVVEQLTQLPDTATREVGGDLGLSGTKITSLPPNLKVGGDLYLGRTNITKLPSGLYVGGDLTMDTKITSLPSDLHVEGRIFRVLHVRYSS